MNYPYTPGYQATDTSKAAAHRFDLKINDMHESVLEALRGTHGMTSDEVATKIGESILTIRPRVTELKRMGLVVDTGSRRKNVSCRSAIVYVATV